MRRALLAFAFAAAAACPLPLSAHQLEDVLKEVAPDTTATVNGVEVACTGVGETRLDPKWANYPIRVEFSDSKDHYVTDAALVLLNAKNRPVVLVHCDGPWVLLRPAPGSYSVYAEMMDSDAQPRSARFTLPSHGQKRVVLKFPDL